MRTLKIMLAVAGLTMIAPVHGQDRLVAPATAGKVWTFEVVSIRENHDPAPMVEFGATADGYRAVGAPMLAVFVAAYVPQTGGGAFYRADEMTGFPEWVRSVRFDIEAKVAEADLADWRKPALHDIMLRSMLRAMLADRLGVRVHRESREVAVYLLEVGRGGVKFKETDPEKPLPEGMTLPGGTVVSMDFKDGQMTMNFYGASMEVVATILSNTAGRPVQDKTGLTGRYDLQFPRPVGVNAPALADGSDPGPSVFTVVEGLGLKLEPAKSQVETLVFDHVERPSAN